MSEKVGRKKNGGPRPGAGRKKGSISKLSGQVLLKEIEKTTGKKFETLVAEHYKLAYEMRDFAAVRDYEKSIMNKVVADVHSIDHTTLGQSMHASYSFNHTELPEWKTLPVTFTVEDKTEVTQITSLDDK